MLRVAISTSATVALACARTHETSPGVPASNLPSDLGSKAEVASRKHARTTCLISSVPRDRSGGIPIVCVAGNDRGADDAG